MRGIVLLNCCHGNNIFISKNVKVKFPKILCASELNKSEVHNGNYKITISHLDTYLELLKQEKIFDRRIVRRICSNRF